MNISARLLPAAIMIIGLVACAPTPPLVSRELVAFRDSSCPKNLAIPGYAVKARLGPDYTICELEPTVAGNLAAELRVGGHWALPADSRFAGFSSTPVGPIAWFYGLQEDKTRARVAYFPTGISFNTAPVDVLIVIKGGTMAQAAEQRDKLLLGVIQGAMRPNSSLKPTPPAFK